MNRHRNWGINLVIITFETRSVGNILPHKALSLSQQHLMTEAPTREHRCVNTTFVKEGIFAEHNPRRPDLNELLLGESEIVSPLDCVLNVQRFLRIARHP